MLSYKIFNSFNDKCYKDWKEISLNGNYSFFQTFDYLKIISSKNSNELKIISIYYKGKIIAYFPLEIKNIYFFKILQWVGTEISDYCNPIIANDFYTKLQGKNFDKLWTDILNDIGKIDLIFFNNQLSEINNISNPFTKYLNSTKFSKVYQIKIENNIDQYLKKLKDTDNKKFYEIQRTINKLKSLENKYNVIFEIKELPDSKTDFKKLVYSKIYQLNKKKIKNKLNEEFIKTFENLIKLKKSRYLLASLKVENQTISTCLGIISKNVFYYYMPLIISENYNNYKPGKILILKIIDWCSNNKIEYFDFGLGDEKYKENFSNNLIPVHRYITHKSFLGRILLFVMKIIFFDKKF